MRYRLSLGLLATRSRLAVLSIFVALFMVANATVPSTTAAAAAGTPEGASYSPETSATSNPVTNAGEYLLDSRVEILKGVRNPDGTCTFSFPVLRLGPNEDAKEARLLKLDVPACVQYVEIGIPPESHDSVSLTTDEGAFYLEEFRESETGSPALPSGPRFAPLSTSGSSTAYYEVRWHDKVNITVNYTRAYVSWSWNGSCVTSSSAWGYYWWRKGTGWSKVLSYGYKTSTCGYAKSVVDWAHYMNNTFCAPVGVEVDVFVDDAWVKGQSDGSINGGNKATWEFETPSNPNRCPDLHYHLKLVRTS